jgi:hypothetical protein
VAFGRTYDSGDWFISVVFSWAIPNVSHNLMYSTGGGQILCSLVAECDACIIQVIPEA